jgi:cysteine desulfuration protein SufE
MSLVKRQKKLVEEYSSLSNWEDRYKRIIDAGKSLAPLPEEFRQDKFKVSGCQSQVWLYPEMRDGQLIFHADSDALITKGLIALLLRVYSGAAPAEIMKTPPDFIKELGLAEKLSPSRANGLFSMIKQIQLYAMVFN